MTKKNETEASMTPEGDPRLEEPHLDLTGGAICLDFANTVDDRAAEHPKELLNRYEDLVQWSLQKGVFAETVAVNLLRVGAEYPRKAAATLRRARVLRESIFDVFHAAARGMAPPSASLDTLNRHLPAAFQHLCLYRDEAGYHWECEEDDALDRMLWPLVRSAADLLTSDRLARVRICAADTCDWLFLDHSKNRSRRWCDMAVCGNRSKVRRFRETRSTS